MNLKRILLAAALMLIYHFSFAQLTEVKEKFTRTDTLRGSITKYRKGWDVVKYDLTVQPDIVNKTISGKNIITYNETLAVTTMQIDLQQPLMVDSIIGETDTRYNFKRDSNICWVYLRDSLAMYKIKPGIRRVSIFYHGKPREAKRPPWDGGLIWKTDEQGNPFISTACQGLGASVWWPCKDHQSDEPDSGMSITIIAPDTLSAVSNGRLKNISPSTNGLKAWRWEVKDPINNYDAALYIGKYAHWEDTLMGEGGKLDLQFWVLAYNLDKARKQFVQAKTMLHSHEHWFGKYPFYDDSYKLVEAPHLGMEHQSAVAYGNKFQNGYLGRDLSGSGWGLKWDFIIIHESGHEWFGNNITSKDLADMWLHEGFTNYSETLYTETLFGKEAASEYNYGTRKNIKNDRTIIGYYGVNNEGSGDMYYKGGNLLHMIRRTIQDDEKFRNILRGLNHDFYHQTVTTQQVENYISTKSGIDFSKVFDQYLRTTQVPVLNYYTSKNNKKLFFKWSNCVNGFALPVIINNANQNLSFTPTEKWKSISLPNNISLAQLIAAIEKGYYINLKQEN